VIDTINHQLSLERGMLPSLTSAGFPTEYVVSRVRDTMVPNIRRLAATCRSAGALVVFMRVGSSTAEHRDSLPALRDGLRRHDGYDGGWGCEVIDELQPEPSDVSLMKAGSGAFIGSPLDALLRNAGVEHVLYTGVISHACVLLSVGEGFDLGYYGYFVSDGTAAFSQRLQDFTEEIVSGYMARVVSTDDAIDLLVPSVGDQLGAARAWRSASTSRSHSTP
jgi:nicotinamidase-related amidase